jgi:2-polyprenyl-3-methyl-5-hydroxy-6-metoxy-1,4-benzoquinol methylase
VTVLSTEHRSQIYQDKPVTYYQGAAGIMVEALRTGSSSAVLEVGCGNGATARLGKAAGKAQRWVGIELDSNSAAQARDALDEVLCGDVEQLALDHLHQQFDALLMSEVLEHLTDPWTTLERLLRCLKPGGFVLASSPNLAHWRVIWRLMKGRFDYEPDGVMDRTHLRWFTSATYREMFEAVGLQVLHSGPLCAPGPTARAIIQLSGGRLSHLFAVQNFVHAQLPVPSSAR